MPNMRLKEKTGCKGCKALEKGKCLLGTRIIERNGVWAPVYWYCGFGKPKTKADLQYYLDFNKNFPKE